MIINHVSSGNALSVIKLKQFVYRTSRTAGGSVSPPPFPITDNF